MESKINYVHVVKTCIDSYMFSIDTVFYKVYDERGCLQQKQTRKKHSYQLGTPRQASEKG